jgi:hypothetical protein
MVVVLSTATHLESANVALDGREFDPQAFNCGAHAWSNGETYHWQPGSGLHFDSRRPLANSAGKTQMIKGARSPHTLSPLKIFNAPASRHNRGKARTRRAGDSEKSSVTLHPRANLENKFVRLFVIRKIASVRQRIDKTLTIALDRPGGAPLSPVRLSFGVEHSKCA